MKRNTLSLFCWLVVMTAGFSPSYCFAEKNGAAPGFISAKSALLIDAADGDVLFEKQPDLALPPASTTKVMTALVALEQKPLQATMRVSRNATLAPPCRVGVRSGEKWSMEDLLPCVLLASANDASVVIAEGTAGSVGEFASLMNRKAQEMGAMHTHFANPHGLDQANHYTTARDMTIIFQHAVTQPVFRQIAGTKSMTVTSPSRRRIHLRNHNRLLDRYEGMLYGKTGYTSRARRCFVGKAKRDNRELIVCVLGSRDHFRDAARLLDYGFQQPARPDSKTPPAAILSAASSPAATDLKGYSLQMGSFCDSANASVLKETLITHGYHSFIDEVVLESSVPFYRVKVGYFPDLASATITRVKLTKNFPFDPLIVQEKEGPD